MSLSHVGPDGAARMVDVGAVASIDQVIVIAKNGVPSEANPQGEVLLRFGGYRVKWDNAGGRYGAVKVRSFTVFVRTGDALDKGTSDEQWLIGQDAAEDLVANAYLDWPPTDAEGNMLLTEPMHLASTQAPQKEDDDVWGMSAGTWELNYQPAAVDPTDVTAS